MGGREINCSYFTILINFKNLKSIKKKIIKIFCPEIGKNYSVGIEMIIFTILKINSFPNDF